MTEKWRTPFPQVFPPSIALSDRILDASVPFKSKEMPGAGQVLDTFDGWQRVCMGIIANTIQKVGCDFKRY